MSDLVLSIISPELDRQLLRLREPAALSDDEIHEFRVLCKRLRALLQLYRGERSAHQIQDIDRQLKSLSGAFASARDSVVIIEGLSRLAEFDVETLGHLAPLFELLRHQKQGAMPDQSALAEQFDALIKRWWASLACDRESFVERGLDASYKKARALSRKAVAGREDELYHQWRKWMRYWLFQLEFLKAVKGKPAQKYLLKLEKLGSRLGRFHDDCVLELTLEAHRQALPETCVDSLLETLAIRKKKLKRRFKDDAQQLFGKSAKRLKVQGIGVTRR